VITDACGIPLATTLTGANRHDVTQLKALVEAIPAVRGQRGRPRRRPDRVQGDRAYDSQPHRLWLRSLGIASDLARRREEHGSGLGVHRWVVERTLSWFHQFRRLRTRYDRRADIHESFMALGTCLICWRFLEKSLC
jgi:transposase